MKTCLAILTAAILAGCGGSPSHPANHASTDPTSTSTSSSDSSTSGSSTSGSSSASSSGASSSGSSSSQSSSATSNVPPQAKTIANLQTSKGWTGYALLPPKFGICSSCSPGGPKATWSSQQGVSSPSLSGKSMKFTIGGKMKYADVLWNNHLIGHFSSQGMPDWNEHANSKSHNFVYDVYFFADHINTSQALEFDINQFVDGKSYIWGHECRIAGGNQWDVWDNHKETWHPMGVGCWPKNNAWNHLTIQVQRTSDDHLLFKSITLNGKTTTLNHYDTPTQTSWSGITVNYQQDGNAKQQPYSIWLDKFSFKYW